MRGTGGDGQTDRQTQCKGTCRACPGQGQTLQEVMELPLSVRPSVPAPRGHPCKCLALGDDTQLGGGRAPLVGCTRCQCTPPSVHPLMPPR